MVNALMFSIGGAPLYTLRIFPTTFILAAMARWFKPDAFVSFPGWLTSDLAVGVLACLALAEILANKIPELNELLQSFDREIKVAAYFVYSGVILRTGAITIAEQPTVQTMGILPSWNWVLAGFFAAGVWFLAGTRSRVMSVLIETDDDDSLGIRRLISWAEDGWAIIGTIFLVVMPFAALLISGLTMAGLVLVQRAIDAREKKQLVPCASCGQSLHPAALTCRFCHAETPQPLQVNFVGLPTLKPVHDRQQHRLELVSKRRCMVCASKLPKRAIQQKCEACGSLVLPSEAWFDAYLSHVKGRLGRTLGVCFCFGLVPVIGLIPGIIYFRFGLISNLRRYAPPTVGFAARWVVRIISIILLTLQGIPILGALALPAMCLVNYYVYRAVLLRERSRHFGLSHQMTANAELSVSTP
jgi:hypothetical protein